MVERNGLLVERIVGEIDFVLDASKAMTEDDFAGDVFAQHALTMAILNIGELAGRLGSDYRARHTEIPWQQIVGFRNAAAHSYDGLDMGIVWRTVRKDLPELKAMLLAL
ncbi:MAG: DUF86 domain-containing protein [Coriobacteriales bacterium]|jgi:uncharacterized protein with HEPN domain|nr:DUF86 domain-containing protein [Coriobacteriales bacterium]